MRLIRTGHTVSLAAICVAASMSGCGGDTELGPGFLGTGEGGKSGQPDQAAQSAQAGSMSVGQSADPGVDVATRGPGFAGAGTMGAGAPITAEASPSSCGATGTAGSTALAPATSVCFFPTDGSSTVAAVMERVVEVAHNEQVVHVRLTLNPGFVDNTYGTTAIGWGGDADAGAGASSAVDPAKPPAGPATDPKAPAGPTADPKAAPGSAADAGTTPKPKAKKPGKGGHTFEDLVGSDKAEFRLSDGAGNLVMDFFVDYISVDTSKPSGYGCLGVTGGEGKVMIGDASDIVAATTSLDRNLNACGYSSYLENSPATDANYTPASATPGWDYRVVYDVWVKASAFGSSGVGNAEITYVHASPSKSSDTLPVTPKPCPPGGGANGQAGGSGAGGSGAGGSSGDDGQGGHGGEPDTTFDCLPDTHSCIVSEDCCSGVCCNGVCGSSACVN